MLLEFGARSTGEPHELKKVVCDMAAVIDGLEFPSATPRVMKAERTFWEKATAAHVYCLQGRLRGDRYSRHWHDLAAFAKSPILGRAAQDRSLATQVAEHKSMFFAENDAAGKQIDYFKASGGGLRLIPEGRSRAALERDYLAMLDDVLLPAGQPDFNTLLDICASIEKEVNLLA